ncbi:MAG: ROK family protein [Bacteroidota bacterium]
MNILGIDVGGSGIKGAPVDTTTGTLLADRFRIDTPQPSTPKAMAKVVKEISKHFSWNGPIGCGFPAPIQKGVAKTATNIDDSWIGTSVEKTFGNATGCPVRAVNDADAAGIAENVFGAGQGRMGVTILLTIGTGIGSALFQDGKLIPNTELGHLIFKDGKIAEWYASDSARKRNDLKWGEWGKRFNKYLNHVHKIFYPDLIIVGGGASKKFNQFEDELDVPTEVVPAQSLNQAGIIGAALAGIPEMA